MELICRHRTICGKILQKTVHKNPAPVNSTSVRANWKTTSKLEVRRRDACPRFWRHLSSTSFNSTREDRKAGAMP